MVERIQELIRYLGISPSQFADEIGVQRSAMSHLVSGRNNPSLEFVMKVLKRFPEVETDWLLNGKGTMTGETPGPVTEIHANDIPDEPALPFPEPEQPFHYREEPEIPYEKPAPRKQVRPRRESAGEKEIERIIIIYNDRSFRELLPE